MAIALVISKLHLYSKDTVESSYPPKNEIIDKYALTNPNQFPVALGQAQKLDSIAKTLRREGEQQMNTMDSRSSLSGEVSSMEHIRRRGRGNVEQADAYEAESKKIKSAIKEIDAFYSQLLSKSAKSKPIAINGINGNSIICSIIGFYEGLIIAKKQSDGLLIGVAFKQLHPSSLKLVASELLRTLTVAFRINDQNLGVIAEISNGILVKDDDGIISLRKPVGDENILNLATGKQIQKEIEEIESKILDLQKEVGFSPQRPTSKLNTKNLSLGNPQSFIVDRILSFDDFPLREHGEFIYQVFIGGNPTILITKRTQYLTAGRGSLLLTSVGNSDVTMNDGSKRTVPVLVEIDPEIKNGHEMLLALREEKIADGKNLSVNEQKILEIDASSNGAIIGLFP